MSLFWFSLMGKLPLVLAYLVKESSTDMAFRPGRNRKSESESGPGSSLKSSGFIRPSNSCRIISLGSGTDLGHYFVFRRFWVKSRSTSLVNSTEVCGTCRFHHQCEPWGIHVQNCGWMNGSAGDMLLGSGRSRTPMGGQAETLTPVL